MANVGLVLALLAGACFPSVLEDDLTGFQYSGFIAASEFVTGENRFPFNIISLDGEPLENAEVTVRFHYLEEVSEIRLEADALYRRVEGIFLHQHEDGSEHQHIDVTGLYVVEKIQFREPGIWSAEFIVTTPKGQQPTVGNAAFNVRDESQALSVGEMAPSSDGLTAADVDDVREICSGVSCYTMHDLSIRDALDQEKPLVVVFSSPAFCVSRMCGPVTAIVANVQSELADRVNFVHVEPWNLKIARTEGRLVPSSTSLEWELPSEPWLFVINSSGYIVARFEGLVSEVELQEAILDVLT